ncbi:hypothetical protein NMY22_g15290 [Coprinellus aureogranulatus]|nr:hypothetical protein NMY22_g15290 [Coprinellus aureogranulatus]
MAPSVADLQQAPQPTPIEVAKEAAKQAAHFAVPHDESYPYSKYRPFQEAFDKEPALQYFDHVDAGSRADPAKPHLLTKDTKLHHLSPYLGTEVRGAQLSQLSKEGLDELALFVAERKVVVFRDQDLKDVSPEEQLEFASHFGPPHVHPIAVNVEGYPAIAVVYRDEERPGFTDHLVQTQINHTNWHSDVSYEKQPPGTTFFYILDGPEVGGDTLFLSQVEAYKRLSPTFQKFLLGLKAVHTAVPQAEGATKRGLPIRRDPVETEHPIVRVHPVTGEKALFINPGFTSRVVGFKKEESDALLQFLFDHITKGADFQMEGVGEREREETPALSGSGSGSDSDDEGGDNDNDERQEEGEGEEEEEEEGDTDAEEREVEASIISPVPLPPSPASLPSSFPHEGYSSLSELSDSDSPEPQSHSNPNPNSKKKGIQKQVHVGEDGRPLTRRQRKALGLPKVRGVGGLGLNQQKPKSAGKIVIPGGKFKGRAVGGGGGEEWVKSGVGRVDVRGYLLGHAMKQGGSTASEGVPRLRGVPGMRCGLAHRSLGAPSPLLLAVLAEVRVIFSDSSLPCTLSPLVFRHLVRVEGGRSRSRLPLQAAIAVSFLLPFELWKEDLNLGWYCAFYQAVSGVGQVTRPLSTPGAVNNRDNLVCAAWSGRFALAAKAAKGVLGAPLSVCLSAIRIVRWGEEMNERERAGADYGIDRLFGRAGSARVIAASPTDQSPTR